MALDEIKRHPEPSVEVLGVKAPTLTELKTRACSPEELQAALVKLIEMVNSQNNYVAKSMNSLQGTVNNKADKEWKATI